MGDVRVGHEELIRFVTAVFSATGMTTSDAETFAEVLVWANERGIDSHGVVRIPGYLKEIDQGKFNPRAQPLLRQLLPADVMPNGSRNADTPRSSFWPACRSWPITAPK